MGRVRNLQTGAYMEGAEVRLVERAQTTRSARDGTFVFSRVPPGLYSVRVAYTGYPPEIRMVQVVAGRPADGNVTLRSGRASQDGTVTLDAFKVAAKRDMAASDIARTQPSHG